MQIDFMQYEQRTQAAMRELVRQISPPSRGTG
jgi:hypothetical protein